MITRRHALCLMSASIALPAQGQAATAEMVTWDDLIPPGIPYSEIIADGEIDVINDTWKPVYDANAVKLNQRLDGALITMPGYIIPLDFTSAGVHEFILVPYVGACIHTPPPPANQLVIVRTEQPWMSTQLWDPVWVTGTMSTQLQSTNLGQTGYALAAQEINAFQW